MSKALFVALLGVVVVQGLQSSPQHQFLQSNPVPGVPVSTDGSIGAPGDMPGTPGGMYPVSTTMKCVINLTIQYMLIYTALAVCRTAADGFGWTFESTPVTKILGQAALTVNYAPMASVMFLAIRMRVVWLSQGQEWDPQPYACVAMQWVAWSVLMATLVVCVIPLFTGELIAADPKTGDIDENAKPFQNYYVTLGFTILRYICLLALYGGMATVIYASFDYMPANGQWRPMAPAVGATVTMTIMFFLVYIGVALLRTFAQLSGTKNPKLEGVLLASSSTMNFAPMLSILFLAARMRALQMDSVNGAPQAWAQSCFYMCAYALMFQTIFAVAVPLVLGGKVKEGELGGEKVEGDMEYEVENKFVGYFFCVARWCMMLSVYLGATAVIVSIFTLAHPKGEQYTPPISPTVQCVINLCVQFFFAYIGIFICITIKEFTGFAWPLLTDTLQSCLGTIMFCPMLAILFVGTRMRALQMTNNKGAPQGWAQDGMYLATWSLFLQFWMVVLAAACTGEKAKTDDDGNVTWKPNSIYAFYAVQVVRWFSVIALWGGVIAVIVSVFTITPETANGRGAIPFVTDSTVPVVGDQLAGPPPGAQVVPGLEPGGAAGNVGEAVGSTSDYNPVTQGGNAVTSAR